MATSLNPWTPRSRPPDLVLCNVHVVNPLYGSVTRFQDVFLSQGKIKSIIPACNYLPNIKSIDLSGLYLCPGLIDCHVHITISAGSRSVRDLWSAHPDTLSYRTAWNAKQMLLRGFTTVRDTGGANYALREAIAEGLVQGPRLFLAGKALSQTGGHGDLRQPFQGDIFKCCSTFDQGIARVCDGVPACLEAARDELRQGADFLKIMVGGGVASPVDPLEMLQFTPEEIKAITTSAKNLGKYVTAHAYTNEAIRLAIENGVTSIEHGNFIDEETAKLCAEKAVFVTPTLITYQSFMKPEWKDFLPESGRNKCQTVVDSGLSSLKILKNAGVTVCYGTDLLGGMHASQNEEFVIRVGALSNLEILRSATINAAKLLRMEDRIGVLQEGAFADILMLDVNPLDDITVLNRLDRHCFGLMKEGRVVTSKIKGLEIDEQYRG